MTQHKDLIDTTEMYLRTVYELEEEGVVPMRARIAERLGQSGPTVSQTVGRMERDGLLTVAADRRLCLTDDGRRQAIAVMRKHRLAECLLVQIIGMAWEEVHVEACRWEHVMSEAVERRLIRILDSPTRCPHGNPIPGLADLGVDTDAATAEQPVTTLAAVATAEPREVQVQWIGEQLQPDTEALRLLRENGLQPGERVQVALAGGELLIGVDGQQRPLPRHVATQVFVSSDHLV